MAFEHLAAVYALLASCLFGIQVIIAKQGLKYCDPLTGAVITVGSMWVFYLMLTPWYFDSHAVTTTGVWIFIVNGLLHPMLSMYCAIKATSQTGATLAASLSATTPIFSAILAVTLLDESVTTWIALGTLVTVVGVVIATWHGPKLTLSIRTALLFASAAAIIRAVNQIATRWGFGYVDSVMMAGLISISVSFAGLLLIRNWITPEKRLLRTPSQGLAYFAITGILGAAGIIAMFAALQAGDVVLVAPIIAAFPLFTLITGRLLGTEYLGRRIVIGCLLILAGVLIVSTA